MKFLVTGCSGFIGRAVTRQLLEEGNDVLGISRQESGISHPRFTACLSDFTCWGLLEGPARNFQPDHVIHAAWYRTHDYSEQACRINLLAGLNLLAFAFSLPSVKNVTALGSCLEFSPDLTWFSWCKESLAKYGTLHAGSTGKGFRWLRIFYAYGPGQREAALIPSLVKAGWNGKPLECSKPDNVCDFIHVDDVANAIVKASYHMSPDALFLDCGSGTARRLRDVATCVEGVFQGLRMEPSAVDGFAADIALPGRSIGWTPRISLADGISQLVSRV